MIESARLRYSTGAGTVGSRVLAARGALKTRNALREEPTEERGHVRLWSRVLEL